MTTINFAQKSHWDVSFEDEKNLITDLRNKFNFLAYVSKFVVEKEVFSTLADFFALPTDEFGLKRFQNGGSWACAVDENHSETSWWMLQAKAC